MAEHSGVSLADQPIQVTLTATAKLDCLSAFQQAKVFEIVLQLFVKMNTKGKHFRRHVLYCLVGYILDVLPCFVLHNKTRFKSLTYVL